MDDIPIIDLHCDLLSYLVKSHDRTPYDVDGIGAAIPHLKAGNVCLQVMAIFSRTETGSSHFAQKQIEAYEKIRNQRDGTALDVQSDLSSHALNEEENVRMYHALENASGMWEEEEPLAEGFSRMDVYMKKLGKPFYISLTHNTENRFGGGNYSGNVGIKPDGKSLLAWMGERGIAIDFSHTSDALAYDILTFIEKEKLKIPLVASHSNSRAVFSHLRNLPTEIIEEIILKEGLIGMNFFRPFVHDTEKEVLFDHLTFLLEKGGEEIVAFGADFFDPSAISVAIEGPAFFPNYDNASFYPYFLAELKKKRFLPVQISKLAWKNVIRFMKQHLILDRMAFL